MRAWRCTRIPPGNAKRRIGSCRPRRPKTSGVTVRSIPKRNACARHWPMQSASSRPSRRWNATCRRRGNDPMTRPSKRTPKILVVDDDPGLLRLLTIRLRAQKYEVEPAESAAKALGAVTKFRPDLVITDLRMAEMDGIALLKELRRRWPTLNVIMLTAHGTIPDAVKATQSGAFSFLTKPVEKEQL